MQHQCLQEFVIILVVFSWVVPSPFLQPTLMFIPLKDVVWDYFSSFVSDRTNVIDSQNCLGLIKIVVKPPESLHCSDTNHQKSSIIAQVPTLVDLSPKVLHKHHFLFLITSLLPTFINSHTFFSFLSHIYMFCFTTSSLL
jgi:hypothetical protein